VLKHTSFIFFVSFFDRIHEKLRHVRPSVRMCQLGPHRMDFCQIWYWTLLLTSVELIQIWLISDKNIVQFTWPPNLQIQMTAKLGSCLQIYYTEMYNTGLVSITDPSYT
jgi:hypothetical protein